VLSVLRGEVTIAEASRQYAVSQTSIAKWRDAFLEGGQTLAGGRPCRAVLSGGTARA
jgi:transposase-like protein